MKVPAQTAGKPAEGLRERKRRETRDRIAQAAMGLFLAHGFDATTVDEIATDANVSKRSFFDYFPTKEDVVAAWQDTFGDTLVTAVAARPASEPLVKVVEEAMKSTIATSLANPRSFAIGQFIHDTPALRARDQLKYAKLEQQLAEALAGRVKGEAERVRARLLAMIVIGSMRIGNEALPTRKRTESLQAYADKIFGTIWADLAEFGKSASRR
jgi:AcrR family transcriptional regulator